MGKGRIVEVYCSRGPILRKNPLGGRKKMRVAGSCIVAISERGKVKYYGAGTVKLIPLTRKQVKDIAKTFGGKVP